MIPAMNIYTTNDLLMHLHIPYDTHKHFVTNTLYYLQITCCKYLMIPKNNMQQIPYYT